MMRAANKINEQIVNGDQIRGLIVTRHPAIPIAKFNLDSAVREIQATEKRL